MVVRFMGSPVPGVKFDPIHTDSFVQALCCERPLAARKTLGWPELDGERLIAVPRLALPPAHPMPVGAAPTVSRVPGFVRPRGAALHAPAKMFHDYLRAALKARR
jgi:DNA-binding transcriptional LysR family regulator